MRRFAYGIGFCLCIISILFFLIYQKTVHSIVSFACFWVLIVLAICIDCRNEQLRKERIQRNINTTPPQGFLKV